MQKAWFDGLVDPVVEQRAFLDAVYPLLQQAFVDFAFLAMFGEQVQFDPFDAAAQEWLDTHAFELVKGVTDTTVNQLRTALQEGWDAGEGIPDLARRVRQVFDDADHFRAAMIARTETTATANMAQLSVYRRVGIQYKTWVTADDERVCPICGGLDGRTVGLDEEFSPGIYAPPAHPNCRCTIASASRDANEFPSAG